MAEEEQKNGTAPEGGQKPQAEDAETAKAKGKKNKTSKEAETLKKEAEDAKAAADKTAVQLSELNDKHLRTLAEYENFRKRTQREKEMLFPEATKTAVEVFLPVIDNFERALAAETVDEEFKKGVAMIYTTMQDALKKLGVEEIDAKDKPFDPILHNAVMHIEDENQPENIVCDVLAKGYKIGDLVIRHAMVKVAN